MTLNATIEQRQVYGYYCVGGSGVDPASIYNCNRYPAPQCTVTQSYPINLCDPYLGIYWGCNSGDLRVDLVSCRNMLIYFQPAAQQKVLSLFHFALNSGAWQWQQFRSGMPAGTKGLNETLTGLWNGQTGTLIQNATKKPRKASALTVSMPMPRKTPF